MAKTTAALNGDWEFKEYPLEARRMRDLDQTDWLTAQVPSSIYTCLINAGLINKTDIDSNPENYSWVSEKPWIFKKSFDVTEDLLGCDRIDMLFEGLDTVASIWLNEKLIAKTANMFIPHRFDVTKLLKPSNNTLLVKFDPAEEYAKNLMKRYTDFSNADFENPHRVYIRKAQYQFGWDFCPSLPGCGIFRPVSIEGIKTAAIESVNIKTIDCSLKNADVRITIKLDTLAKSQLDCSIALSCGEQAVSHRLSFKPGEDIHSTIIHIKEPKLWFPRGYGRQDLYRLNIELFDRQMLIDQMSKDIGIRRLKLRKDQDKNSAVFRFEINDQPIYAKGANWIPLSIFPGSVTSDTYTDMLNKAHDANINMLRVWGGGYYENEIFYQQCDKLGIMVWQDFMFSSAYYPDRKWFIDEVKNEAEKVTKRLGSHPSLVLWCGNNEIDWLHESGKLTKSRKFYGKDIYHHILPKIVTEYAPDADYIPTTPYTKKGNYNDRLSLTTHRWEIWTGHQPAKNYICKQQDVPSFVTEFGFQSIPDITTVKNFCRNRIPGIGTCSIEKHNYQIDGNSRLYRYSADLFGTTEGLRKFIYFSQVTQARTAKAYVEHLRAHNTLNNGVLFRQFNDCAPAITWSAIDHNGIPKAIYYYAKRFFADLMVAVIGEHQNSKAELHDTLKNLSAVVVNDSALPLTATLNCRLIDLFGNILDQVALPIAVSPYRTSATVNLPKAISFPKDPCNSSLHLSIEKGSKPLAENLHLYLPDKYIDWPNPRIDRKLSRISEYKWKLDLISDSVAKDVEITTDTPAHFSDNFIDLMPKKEYNITITTNQPETPDISLMPYNRI